MIQKFAKAEGILEVKLSSEKMNFDEDPEPGFGLNKFASLRNTEESEDGYLYVRCRAISSRVNKNNDGWPSSELAKAYKSFIGRPIFVDHNNSDPSRARGIIVDARLHVEDDEKTSAFDPYYASAPENHKPPTWIELLLEVDAKTFPKLANSIRKGYIDAVSMGANIETSVCSVCDHRAKNPIEYCSHVKSKGAEFEITSSNGEKMMKKAYEDCHDITFFEISFVFDPADPTALISEQSNNRLSKTAENILGEENDVQNNALDTENPEDTPPNENDYIIKIKHDKFMVFRGFEEIGVVNEWDDAMQLIEARMEEDPSHGDIYCLDSNNNVEKVDHDSETQKLLMVSKNCKCWKGYERVPGTKPCAPGSCRKCDEHREKETKSSSIEKEAETQILDVQNIERELNYIPQSELISSPADVDTLKLEQDGQEINCPNCHSDYLMTDSQGMLKCPSCSYVQPPEHFDNPDLSIHLEVDVNPSNDIQQIEEEEPEVTFFSPQSSVVINEADWETVSNRVITSRNTKSSAVLPKKKVLTPNVTVKTQDPQNAKVISDQKQPNRELKVSKNKVEDMENENTKDSASEKKLLVAFSLADEFVQLGLVEEDKKLAFVAQLEEETSEALEARKSTITLVKEAGLSRKVSKVAGLPRVPKLAGFTGQSSGFNLNDIPDEAAFM